MARTMARSKAHLLSRPVRYRNADGTPAGETTPPAPAPAPVQTRNQGGGNPPAAPRAVADVTAERGRLLGEAETLQTRSRTEALSAEDETHLDQLLDRIEACNEELP